MKLKNTTQNLIISDKLRVAYGYFGKMKGLMFELPSRFNYPLLFDFGSEERRLASIHMMFVFFPIYAVYLNKDKKIVDLAKLTPFWLNYTPKKYSKYLIEMPVEMAKSIKFGDILEWK